MLKRRNKNNAAKPQNKASVFAAIDRIFWLLFRIVGPMAAAAILTPYFSLLLLLLTALLCWLSARLGLYKVAKSINWSLTGIVLGTAFSLCYWLPLWLGAPLGILMLLGGLAGQAAFERRLGLASEPALADATSADRASAWRDNAVLTPEGQPLRCLDWGELAMGGPFIGTYLFPDGVVLGGIGSSLRFSPSGRYFAAPIPGRERWGLLVLDRETRTVYRHPQLSSFWELDDFTDDEILGRYSPLTADTPARIPLNELLKPESAVPLEPVYDLWLESGWEAEGAPAVREFPSPAGEHVVRAMRYVPGELKALDDPLQPLHYPSYRLQVEGTDSDLLIAQDEPLIWRGDGQALACRARVLDSQERWASNYWLWTAGEGWRQLSGALEQLPDEPVANWTEAVELTADALIINGQFDYPQVNAWGYGHYLQHTMSDIEIAIGHDLQGRLLQSHGHCSEVQLQLSLTGNDAAQCMRSASLSGGERAVFSYQHKDQTRRAYECRIGDWQLPGQWLLDHRVSDCGAYIALVAFAQAPAAPHRVVVADVRQRTLLSQQQDVLIVRLVDFRAGELSLLHMCGRLSEGKESTPLQRFDLPAPAAEQAAAFMERSSGSLPYYELLSSSVTDEQLLPFPRWRVVSYPQVANAADDFVFPAPGGCDAVWLFGAETEYRDNYPRENFPRGGGCLLTASGIGMDDVGPSMIWSDDGRYLAVSRYIRRMDSDEPVDTDQWHLILIDTHERSWRYSAEHIGCMPLFTGFDAQALYVRVLNSDYEVEGDEGTEYALELARLLAVKPEPLQASALLWLPTHEVARSAQWLGLDRSHLQAWNKGRDAT